MNGKEGKPRPRTPSRHMQEWRCRPFILNLGRVGGGGGWVSNFALRPLYRRRTCRYPLNRKLDGPPAGADVSETREICCHSHGYAYRLKCSFSHSPSPCLILTFVICNGKWLPIQATARSKAWVCDRSRAGIAGSKPAGGGMSVCLSVVSAVCCHVEASCDGPTTRLEESYGMWRVWVWS